MSLKIFLLCFHNVYEVSLWEKIANKRLCKISSFYRSSHRRCSAKKLLLKICNIHRKTPVLDTLQAFRCVTLLIRHTSPYVFLRILKNFKKHHFEEHLRTTASYFMNKNRNNSRKKKMYGDLWVF